MSSSPASVSVTTCFALFSPDNRLALQPSYGGPLRVYDMGTGAIKNYSGVAWTEGMPLDYAPDGSHLWVAGVTVWDVLTGKSLLANPPLNGFATLRALRDGTGLLTASREGTLSQWNLRTRQRLWLRQSAEKAFIKYITVSSTLALTTDDHGGWHLYRLRDGTKVHSYDAALKLLTPLTATAFSHNNTMLAGEGINGGIVLLNLLTGRVTLAMGTDRELKAIQFGPQDKTLIAAFSGTICVWDWRANKEWSDFKVLRTGLESSAISPDGRYVATHTTDAEAIWDLNAPSEPRILYASNKSLWHVNYSPDGREVAAGGEDGCVYRWEAATGIPLRTLRGNGVRVNTAAYSHNGQWIAAARADGAVWVWNARTGQRLAAFNAHRSMVEAVCFSRDDRQLITSADDAFAKVWDITASGPETRYANYWSCKERLTLSGHKMAVECVVLSPDETRILTGSDDKTAKLWDARTGTLLATFLLPGEIWSVAFSPDGRRAAFALLNDTAEVWDPASRRKVLVLQGHMHYVTSLAFSPDDKRIVTGSRDETARVWDSESGRELLTLKGHHLQVSGAAFSPDGNQIATSGQDGTVRLWNASPPPDASMPRQ